MSAEKRPAPDAFGSSSQIVKRQKSDAALPNSSSALIHAGPPPSGLAAPLMQLSGHTGEVFTARFDPTGELVASGSMDRNILLWHASGQCDNYGKLSGHKGAVLDLQWSRDSMVLFSASADMFLASWDLETGIRIRRHPGHEAIINCLDVSTRGQELLVSGSDDGAIGMWDARMKEAIEFFETDFPVTAVALSEAASELYTGGLDNDIKVWDLRKRAVAYNLTGHTDTITSLQISPDSQYLLSNSMDSTVRTWDIRPFAPADRAVKTYDGGRGGMEKNLIRASWDKTGDRIAAGSEDRTVVVWDVNTKKLLYKLPGHKGTVNDVRFSPDNSMLLSASSDQTLMLGELGR